MRSRALVVGVVLVVLSLVLAAAGCGGGDGTEEAAAPEPSTPATTAEAPTPSTPDGPAPPKNAATGPGRLPLLAGIPQQGRVLGAPDAPVTLVAYEDFLCTFCARFSREILPGVIEEHVRPGDVKIEYRPVAFYGDVSRRGAIAALAAGRQDRLWDFVETTFGQQGQVDDYLTPEFLARTAEEVGVDVARWERARGADATLAEFEELQVTAEVDGVGGTPTFVVEGPAGQTALPGLPAPEALVEALTRAA